MSQALPSAFITSTEAFTLDTQTRPKFLDLNIFWIKLSDFLDIVPRHPHLAIVRLTTRDFVLQDRFFGDMALRGGGIGSSGGVGIPPPSGTGAEDGTTPNGLAIKEEIDGGSPPRVNGNTGPKPLVNGYR